MEDLFDESAVVAVVFLGELESREVDNRPVERDARRAVDHLRADVEPGAVGQFEPELVLRADGEAVRRPDPES